MSKTEKYDIRAIPLPCQQPYFLARSKDKKLIMRRGENGDYMLFANDQETIVNIPAADAHAFALWILKHALL